MKTEAWWVCNKCGRPIIRPGKKHVYQTMRDHIASHGVIYSGGFSIKQIPQQKKKA